MFYNEEKAIQACEEEPSVIFDLIKEGHMSLVDRILSKKKVDINTFDEKGNDILMHLLKEKQYRLVLKHMKRKEWEVNHQNQEGDTFAHLLVTIHYVHVLEIINQLRKNKQFMPNIKNNKGETILDKSISNHYIYTTVKILEDSRFNNIDVVSFQNLYQTYIKSNHYGKYARLMNLEIILDHLEAKPLLPRMRKLVGSISNNYESIKKDILDNRLGSMDALISNVLQESNA